MFRWNPPPETPPRQRETPAPTVTGGYLDSRVPFTVREATPHEARESEIKQRAEIDERVAHLEMEAAILERVAQLRQQAAVQMKAAVDRRVEELRMEAKIAARVVQLRQQARDGQ